MIRINVEEYCHQCLDFEADVTKPVRTVNDNDEHIQTDTIVQCKYRKRCEAIKRYLQQLTRSEASG